MTQDEREMREAWAKYFDARAYKSEINGDKDPDHRQTWAVRAKTERECAWILRDAMSLDEAFASLKLSPSQIEWSQKVCLKP
jgi:hypothetical protein